MPVRIAPQLLPMYYSLPTLLCLVILGSGIGYISGVFGVGGGFLLTPLLNTFFGIDWATATASGLAQMIFVGGGAAWRHAKAGFVDLRLAGYMAPGIVLGSFAGSAILDWLHRLGKVHLFGANVPIINLVLYSIFSLLLIAIASRLWCDVRSQTTECDGCLNWEDGPWPLPLPSSHIIASVFSLLGSGVVIGVMGGLLGIGGGVILIPLLLYGYGIMLRVAVGTSSLIILVSSLTGAAVKYAHVNLYLVLALVAGSLLGVQLGTHHSHRLPVSSLQRAFAILVVVAALLMLSRLLIPFI